MEAGAKRLTLGAGVAAGALVTAASLMPSLFMQITTKREEPYLLRKARERMTRRLCDAQTYTGVKEAEARLLQKKTERVSVTGVDGTELAGHWYPCEQPKRILIAMHGWRSSWARDFGVAADFWHENGCHVLFAEERGQGASGGSFLTFGMLERYDCLSWANAVCRTFPELPVYLVGISMGATAVLLASELPLPENVHGIIADCGFSSPEEIWRHVTQKKLHVPYRLVERRTNRTCQKRFGCLPHEVTTPGALRCCRVPVLLIHGTEDAFVPCEMSEQAKAACASPCRLLLVDGAKHGESYLKQTHTYRTAMTDFWRENDS